MVLWAWERPESLRFVDSETDVAVLVGTLRLVGPRVSLAPRLQPLALPRATRRIAVVRIESDGNHHPLLSVTQRERTAETILAWATASPGFAALQIDFDAVVSERPFYRDLLVDLRHDLPSEMPLSITALASWCLGDPWISELPIDEAVPMLCRMGIDAEAVRKALDRGVDFSQPLCQNSYGLATDEPMPALRRGRRLYLFHPKPWTEDAYRTAQERWVPDHTPETS